MIALAAHLGNIAGCQHHWTWKIVRASGAPALRRHCTRCQTGRVAMPAELEVLKAPPARTPTLTDYAHPC